MPAPELIDHMDHGDLEGVCDEALLDGISLEARYARRRKITAKEGQAVFYLLFKRLLEGCSRQTRLESCSVVKRLSTTLPIVHPG